MFRTFMLRAASPEQRYVELDMYNNTDYTQVAIK
jgi:hypothetical protein